VCSSDLCYGYNAADSNLLTFAYYGGTAYSNKGGLGVQWVTDAEVPGARLTVRAVETAAAKTDESLSIVPVWMLFDAGMLFKESELMHHRVPEPFAEVNSEDAARALGRPWRLAMKEPGCPRSIPLVTFRGTKHCRASGGGVRHGVDLQSPASS